MDDHTDRKTYPMDSLVTDGFLLNIRKEKGDLNHYELTDQSMDGPDMSSYTHPIREE